jgi:Tol biopolymer transport system component
MSLPAGARVGPYEVVALLGEGGMGTVYRAHDAALDRDVALKVLPESFASDPDRLVRFEREARTLASLNHPHIAQVFAIEEIGRAGPGSSRGIVMELVEGEDLSQRLARGAVPLDDALPIARQIAEALEAAHEAGIIHRDLKPANIKIRADGTVKVLDFGLAKPVEQAAGAGGGTRSISPTITSPAVTQAGIILGTAAYMSPEQAKGKAVDTRADIWAFGCVLFEMLSGRRAFDGEDVTDIIVALMSREPDWTLLHATPPNLTRLIRRCLEKDPRRRLRDIGDARLELEEEAKDDVVRPPAAARHRAWTMAPWAVAAALGVALAIVLGMPRAPASEPSTYVAATLAVATPDLTTLTDRFAVAPDGSAIALVGNRGGIALRRRGELAATPIAGAPPGAFAPVFSPDSRWIAFSGGDALMKIPVTGGTPVTLSRSEDYFINLTWSADDRIRYPSRNNSAIRSVSANGGAVESIEFGEKTWVSRAYGLPDGRLLVSIIARGKRTIAVREPDGELRTLVDGWDGRLTPTGQLLFAQAEGATWSLAAVPFDARSASIAGAAQVVAGDIAVHYATPVGGTTAGDLFYVSGSVRSERRVVTIDATGSQRDVALPAGPWVFMQLAPDGRQLAISRWDNGRRSIWSFALATGALTRLTYSSDSFYPVWMPDGRHLLFTQFPMDRESQDTSMWIVATDGTGRIEPIGHRSGGYPTGTSADGRVLYYRFEADAVQTDILQLALDARDAQPTSVLATPASEQAALPSPDGRWLAYATEASGREEVRVLDLADRSASMQVSGQGGQPIRWNAASTLLYYVDGEALSVIGVGRDGPIPASRKVAFRLPSDMHGQPDVTPDGERAVVIRGGPIYQDLIVVEGVLRTR